MKLKTSTVSTSQIFGNVLFWSGGLTGLGSRTNARGDMRELHAATNNVNICRVWMGREEVGGGAG